MNRTIVYIDGQNFLHRCTESLIKSGAIESQEQLTNINIRMIFEDYLSADDLEIRYYGVSKIKQCNTYGQAIYDKSRKFADALRRTRSNLMAQEIILKDVGQLRVRDADVCKNCGFTDYKFQEKGVDVGLATDLVKDALLKSANHFVLASSDIDMLPAIKSAREVGAKVTYAGFDDHLNNALIRQTDNLIAIHRVAVLKAYISAMNHYQKVL